MKNGRVPEDVEHEVTKGSVSSSVYAANENVDVVSSSSFHTFSLHITNIASAGECDNRFPRLTYIQTDVYICTTDRWNRSILPYEVSHFSFTPNKKSQY